MKTTTIMLRLTLPEHIDPALWCWDDILHLAPGEEVEVIDVREAAGAREKAEDRRLAA